MDERLLNGYLLEKFNTKFLLENISKIDEIADDEKEQKMQTILYNA